MVDTHTMDTRAIKTMIKSTKGLVTMVMTATSSNIMSTDRKVPNANRLKRANMEPKSTQLDLLTNLMIHMTTKCLKSQVKSSSILRTATQDPRTRTRKWVRTRAIAKWLTTVQKTQKVILMVDTMMSGMMISTIFQMKTTALATMTIPRVKFITLITCTHTPLRRVHH